MHIFKDCNNICNIYATPFVTNSTQLLTAIVTNVVTGLLANPAMKIYFDGTKPAGSVNFTSPSRSVEYANLAKHLIEFFGNALGCTDGGIGNYTGKNMKVAHTGLGITKADFDLFNDILINVTKVLGVNSTHQTAIRSVLDTTTADIVETPVTTPGPTTAGPTTAGPTTAGPTTKAPTNAPTTVAPTNAPTVTPTATKKSSANNIAVLFSLFFFVFFLI